MIPDPEDLNALVDGMRQGLLIYQEGVVAYVNSAFRRLFNLGEDTPVAAIPALSELLQPEDAKRLLSAIAKPNPTSAKPVRILTRLNRDATQELACFIAPITWGKKTAFCLSFEPNSPEGERLFQTLLDQSPEGLLIHAEGVVQYANQWLVDALGFQSRADLIGMQVESLVCQENFQHSVTTLKGITASGKSGEKSRVGLLCRQGHPLRLEAKTHSTTWEENPAVRVTLWDASELETIQKRLEMLAEAVSQAGDLIFITDVNGVIEYVNPAFERITGYSSAEVLGETPRILNSHRKPTAYYAKMWEHIKTGQVWMGHHANRRKDGSLFEVDAVHSPIRDEQGNITHFIAVHHDITDRVSLEAQMRHSQKMEALGNMASGLAHEFNNLLQVMRGYSELAQRQAKENPKLERHLDSIQKAVDKASDLTRHLLTFTSRQEMELQWVNLNALLEEIAPVLRPLIGENVALVLKLEPGLPDTKLEPVLVEQLILNLSLNARDAMPMGGKLTLSTTRINPDQALIERHPQLKDTSCILVSVQDTGTGIPDHMVEHIFNPFFTTKRQGQGTGLGLSTAYGIVAHHKGAIEFSTQTGRGTEFRVYLPIFSADAGEDKKSSESLAARSLQTILVAEDDQGVLEFVVQVLKDEGYTVLVANDGLEALALFDAHYQAVHLVMLDVQMPRMTGPDAFRVMRKKAPTLRAIFSSGHNFDFQEFNSEPLEECVVLKKPFFQDELLYAVQTLLRQRSPSA